MDHIAAVEQQLVSERMRRKLNEVNIAAQAQLAPVQDHINFTLQQAYFKCAYECFDRTRKQEEISNCVEHCSVPVVNAQQHFENEMAKFQKGLLKRICKWEIVEWNAIRSLDVLELNIYLSIIKLEERLNRSLMVCQDKFESAKLQQNKADAINELESCVNQSIEDNMKTLPHLVGRMKASFNIGH
ncbi:protein FAM136A-like protein [Gossypium australe]|uniref:Protein FAM136A-like protein n=1 Tax=Gossypium australe TaxID=47621 RepID=A0A5B6U9V2_9ROSI|nr:protein FAM136A-like protein [Gossypium australe]